MTTRRAKASRPQVGLRVSESMRIRLEKTARQNGCSINSEVIARLERSFETEDRFGGPQVIKIIEVVGAAMQSTGQNAAIFASVDKDSWLAHPYGFDQAIKAAAAVLEHHRPPGKIVVPKPNDEKSSEPGDLRVWVTLSFMEYSSFKRCEWIPRERTRPFEGAFRLGTIPSSSGGN